MLCKRVKEARRGVVCAWLAGAAVVSAPTSVRGDVLATESFGIIPEPGTLTLVGAGLGMLLLRRRK